MPQTLLWVYSVPPGCSLPFLCVPPGFWGLLFPGVCTCDFFAGPPWGSWSHCAHKIKELGISILSGGVYIPHLHSSGQPVSVGVGVSQPSPLGSEQMLIQSRSLQGDDVQWQMAGRTPCRFQDRGRPIGLLLPHALSRVTCSGGNQLPRHEDASLTSST